MNDLISRKALLAEYDRVHIGPPGGARKLIEEAPAVQQWISVKDRLPAPYEKVFTCRRELLNGTKIICTEYIAIEYGEVLAWSNDYETWKSEVTHWMELPKPPKGE